MKNKKEDYISGVPAWDEPLEKFVPDWNLKKTIIILNEDNTIYAEYDYIDWLQFRVQLLQGGRFEDQKFYIRNEHGGKNLITDSATPYQEPFPSILKLIVIALKLQIAKMPTQKERIEQNETD
jgi:hypothetical protein